MLATGGIEAGDYKHIIHRAGRALAVAGILICGFTIGAEAAECGRTVQRVAPTDLSIEVRRLQTKLMVAALSCEDSRPAYNDFVVHYRPVLRRHGDALKAKFRREYGGGYQSKLDSFVTLLANQASQQSITDRAGFCADARATFARLGSGASRLDNVVSSDLVERTAMSFHYQGTQVVACSDSRSQ